MPADNEPRRAASDLALLLCHLLDQGVSRHELLDALDECLALLRNVAEVKA